MMYNIESKITPKVIEFIIKSSVIYLYIFVCTFSYVIDDLQCVSTNNTFFSLRKT